MEPAVEPIPPAGAGPTDEEVIVPPVAPPVVTEEAVPPSAVVMATSPEVETFNLNLAISSFGVDRSSLLELRQAGWSWADIHMMANIASRSNRPILEIAGLRSQGMSWNAIAGRYNLTATEITTPMLVRTRVAGFVGEFGFQPIYYKTDPWGNPVLTRYEAERLSKLGYDWQSIAIAANISAETGANIRDVLSWIDRGYTWPQVARQFGLDPQKVMDVSRYPFAREPGGMMVPVTTAPSLPPAGAGPMEPGVTAPLPPTVEPGTMAPPPETVPTY